MQATPVMRSLLFVPADSEPKLTKAKQIAADALILDWEDAVLPENKASARRLSRDFLLGRTSSKPSVLIRCNPVGSRSFAEDCIALDAILPDGILLSKCQSAAEVLQLDEVLNKRDSASQVRVYPLVESPLGLLNAFAIVTCTTRVAGLGFGAEDFSAEMRISRTPGEIELLYARSALVTACHAAGRDAIDSPCLEWKDPDRLRAHVQAARNLGFTGKLAIHPAQVPVVNDVFSPSPSEVERARRMVDAFSASGSAVLAWDGTMVDEAVVRRARQILEWQQEQSPPNKGSS
jgi:citrate lyase subunit beta/citryl-CoA lyase